MATGGERKYGLETKQSRYWMKKAELPNFEGSDPLGWIAKAEKFFMEQEILQNDHSQWAFMNMEGEAM